MSNPPKVFHFTEVAPEHAREEERCSQGKNKQMNQAAIILVQSSSLGVVEELNLCVCLCGAKGKNPQHLISTPQLLLWIACVAGIFN